MYDLAKFGHRGDFPVEDVCLFFGSGAHTAVQRALDREVGMSREEILEIGSAVNDAVPGIDEEEVQDRQQLPPDHALQRRTYRFGSLWHDAAGFFGALSQYFDYLFQFGQHEEPSVTQKRLPAELRITVRRKPLTIKSYIFYMERTPFVYRRGDFSAHMPPPGSS